MFFQLLEDFLILEDFTEVVYLEKMMIASIAIGIVIIAEIHFIMDRVRLIHGSLLWDLLGRLLEAPLVWLKRVCY